MNRNIANKALPILLAACATGLSACGHGANTVASPQHSKSVHFIAHCQNTGDDSAAAYAAAQGPTSWTADLHARASSPLTTSGDCVFLGTADHRLVALDVRTGSLKWYYLAGDEIIGAPVSKHNVVVLNQGNGARVKWAPPDTVALGNGTNAVYGIDLNSESVLWYDAEPGAPISGGPIVGPNYIFEDGTGNLRAVDFVSGKQVWAFNRHLMSAGGSPAGGSNDVTVASAFPNRVTAYDASTGKRLWLHGFPANAFDFATITPLVASDKAIIAYLQPASTSALRPGGAAVPHIAALDLATGRRSWDIGLQKGPYKDSTHDPQISEDGGKIYVANPLANEIVSVDSGNGHVDWTISTSLPVRVSPLIVDGKLLALDENGTLLEYAPSTGRMTHSMAFLGSRPTQNPIHAANALIVSGDNGIVKMLKV